MTTTYAKKHVNLLNIIDNKKINTQYFILKVQAPHDISNILPGQFVNILVTDTRHAFLRRPISIYDIHPLERTIDLLIQVVGEGTHLLSKLKAGEQLDVLYPLGKSFSLLESGKIALLVGGGVGIAPLLFLAKKLYQKGVDVHILLGGKGSNNIIETKNFEKYGKVYIATEDGSQGERGLLTQHSILRKSDFDMIYSCGPDAMMRAVANIAAEHTIECEVSLENMMACGIGSCLCCVTPTKSGHQCVCSDGPVFNTKTLEWNK